MCQGQGQISRSQFSKKNLVKDNYYHGHYYQYHYYHLLSVIFTRSILMVARPYCSVILHSVNSGDLFTGQHFGLLQIESICRRQIQCGSNVTFLFDRVVNIVGKLGRRRLLPAFFLFRKCFHKVSFPWL